MSKELTEAKELIRQAEDKVSQHELLEEVQVLHIDCKTENQ